MGYDPAEVRFVIDRGKSGWSERFSITDWEIGDPEFGDKSYVLPQSGEERRGWSCGFRSNGLARYYAGTIFATVAIIACMSWLVFWLPPSAVNPRIRSR